MALRIGINGFGRIGRLVYRAAFDQGIEIVAVNDLVPSDNLAYLLQYDSTHRRFHHKVTGAEGSFSVSGKTTKCFAEKDPSKLPWKDLGVHYVLESTGLFTSHDGGRARVLQVSCLSDCRASARRRVRSARSSPACTR